MRKAVYFCFLIFFCCCHTSLPKGILDADKMGKVVYDVLSADEYINNFVVKDTSVNIKMKRSVLYEQIFKLHNTNRKEFYASYKYYQQHPDIQKKLFDSLLAKANRTDVIPKHLTPVKPAIEKNK